MTIYRLCYPGKEKIWKSLPLLQFLSSKKQFPRHFNGRDNLQGLPWKVRFAKQGKTDSRRENGAFNGSDRNRLRLETGTFYGKSFAVLRASSLLLSELEDIDNCLEWAKKGWCHYIHLSCVLCMHSFKQFLILARSFLEEAKPSFYESA